MASAPFWKVFSPAGEYRACFKCPTEAASLVALLGDGATLRVGHAKKGTVWTEGMDGRAAESFDTVGDIARERLAEFEAAWHH